MMELTILKVLLTGGAGYIGTHTCIELIKSGYSVTIADDYSNSKPETIRRVHELTNKQISVYPIDVSNYKDLDNVFSTQKIDVVIHFAGFKSVGESVTKPLKYYRNNIGTTLTLLEVMEKHHVNKLIFSSSATVYGIPEKLPLTEFASIGFTTNPYGRTKLIIEQILTDAAVANDKLSIVQLRYFNPIGAHESGCIGEDPNGIPNNLMPYISQVAAGKLERLSVFGSDYPTKDGTGVRDYIHVVDLAKGHVAAIDYADKHTGSEVFNLGTGTGYSVLDILKTFEKVNDVSIPFEFASRRSGDIAECYADASKAAKILKWKAEKTLVDMCRDAWRWQKSNPDGY